MVSLRPKDQRCKIKIDLNKCYRSIFVLHLSAYKINIHIKIFILITTAVNSPSVLLFVIGTRDTGN